MRALAWRLLELKWLRGRARSSFLPSRGRLPLAACFPLAQSIMPPPSSRARASVLPLWRARPALPRDRVLKSAAAEQGPADGPHNPLHSTLRFLLRVLIHRKPSVLVFQTYAVRTASRQQSAIRAVSESSPVVPALSGRRIARAEPAWPAVERAAEARGRRGRLHTLARPHSDGRGRGAGPGVGVLPLPRSRA